MLLERAGQSLVGTVSRRLSEQTRSIHIPRRIGVQTSPANLVYRTRALFNRLITQIQGTTQTPHVPQFIHNSPSIRQSLSLPARVALSRPLRAPCLPKASHVPGNITHVGLGTARHFSSGRPIFQHLAENVPVAGRSFYEVDLDLKLREEKSSKVRRPKEANRKVMVQDKLTPTLGQITLPAPITSPITSNEEAQHYFQTPSTPLVTTYIQIPLAPTPTSRVPLSHSPVSPRLLPLPALAKEHASHSKHAIRVSSLFRRLDAARVWERGASCETYGDPSGLCTILRIKFEGWSESMLKDVLGDAGKDWCTIQEIRLPPEESHLSQDSLLLPTMHESISLGNYELPDISFVMPTLDFSTSISSTTSPLESWSTMPSSPMTHSDSGSVDSCPSELAWDDSGSDTSTSDHSLLSSSNDWTSAVGSSSGQNVFFSSEFARRASYYPSNMF